jgi:hypothetical protein
MRHQACHVDSLCDHSMPEETHPVRGQAISSSIPRSVRRSYIRTQTPVSSCSDCVTRSPLFVEVRVPGLKKRPYECWRHCPPEHPIFAGVDGRPSWRRRSG